MTTPTTSLSECITNDPAPLKLKEQLTEPGEPPHGLWDIPTDLPLPLPLSHTHSPTPPPLPEQPFIPLDTCPPSQAGTEPCEADVNIGMYGHDLVTPQGFTCFDHTIPNHHHYGKKIHMPDNTYCWPHYIKFSLQHY